MPIERAPHVPEMLHDNDDYSLCAICASKSLYTSRYLCARLVFAETHEVFCFLPKLCLKPFPQLLIFLHIAHTRSNSLGCLNKVQLLHNVTAPSQGMLSSFS